MTGYVASNDLMVRVRDFDRLGAVLDVIVVDGANAMNGLSFDVQPSAVHLNRSRARKPLALHEKRPKCWRKQRVFPLGGLDDFRRRRRGRYPSPQIAA